MDKTETIEEILKKDEAYIEDQFYAIEQLYIDDGRTSEV